MKLGDVFVAKWGVREVILLLCFRGVLHVGVVVSEILGEYFLLNAISDTIPNRILMRSVNKTPHALLDGGMLEGQNEDLIMKSSTALQRGQHSMFC